MVVAGLSLNINFNWRLSKMEKSERIFNNTLDILNGDPIGTINKIENTRIDKQGLIPVKKCQVCWCIIIDGECKECNDKKNKYICGKCSFLDILLLFCKKHDMCLSTNQWDCQVKCAECLNSSRLFEKKTRKSGDKIKAALNPKPPGHQPVPPSANSPLSTG